jgi:hypothetical protein
MSEIYSPDLILMNVRYLVRPESNYGGEKSNRAHCGSGIISVRREIKSRRQVESSQIKNNLSEAR